MPFVPPHRPETSDGEADDEVWREIDRLVTARLETEGWTLAPEADRETRALAAVAGGGGSRWCAAELGPEERDLVRLDDVDALAPTRAPVRSDGTVRVLGSRAEATTPVDAAPEGCHESSVCPSRVSSSSVTSLAGPARAGSAGRQSSPSKTVSASRSMPMRWPEPDGTSV